MTREEAIRATQFYKEKLYNGIFNQYIDAFDMAISALRQQETVTKCNDLFDEDGGEILNDEAATERHQMTNADRIRAMSDEEIAEYVCRNSINTLCGIICGGECNAIATLKKSGDLVCKENVMKWLQQPAGEEDKHEAD